MPDKTNHLNQEELTELITRITLEVLEKASGISRDTPSIPNDSIGGESIHAVSCECSGDDLSSCVSCGHCVVLRDDMGNIINAGADRVSSRPGMKGISIPLAQFIDHTLLKPDVTESDLRILCDEALKHKFASVCVNSGNVPLVAKLLKGSDISTTAVVGFPLGAMSTAVKTAETKDAVESGADEIDMVLNIGALKSKAFDIVFADIHSVVEAAEGRIVKVILETALLEYIEKIAACILSKAAGAHFVKTSTGFGPKGATVEDVKLMRKIVGSDIGVKASGGIRDRDTACKMIEAGATRIGASASVGIVKGESAKGAGY